MVDAVDGDRFFAGCILPVFVQDVGERDGVEFMLDAVGNRLPDRLGFADRLTGAVVGFVPETDHEAHPIVKERNHLAEADVFDGFQQADAAVRADDGVGDAMTLEFSMDVFDYLVADIDPFSQCGDGQGGLYLVQFINQPDGVAGVGGEDHRRAVL